MPDQIVQPDGDFIVEGDIVVRDTNGVVRIRLDHETGSIFIHNDQGDIVFHWEMPGNNLQFGGHSQDGDLVIFPKSATNLTNLNQAAFHVNSQAGSVRVGGNDIAGQLICLDSEGNQTVFLGGENSHVVAGGNGRGGVIFARNAGNLPTIRLEGETGNVFIGGVSGVDGDLHLQTGGGETAIFMQAEAPDGKATLNIGGDTRDGRVVVRNSSGEQRMLFDGRDANLFLGGPGADGDLHLRDNSGVSTIIMQGETGDIVLRNADLAEEFAVKDPRVAVPGTVMVLNDEGLLEPCSMVFDKRVVGVVSGVDKYAPALLLDRQPQAGNRRPVALVGKVFCKVTAASGAGRIAAGDSLAAADVPGHAMKVEDLGQAVGAIIGQALAPHAEGEGLIPILVRRL